MYGGSASGNYHGTHWKDIAYRVYTYQVKKSKKQRRPNLQLAGNQKSWWHILNEDHRCSLGVNLSFGKPTAGKTNPTIWLMGQIGGSPTSVEQEADVNLYRSNDMGMTRMRVNDAQRGLVGVNNITGDMQKYGRVYIGTGGRGTFRGEIATK